MSFFYLSPVKGNMPVHLLETILTKRLEYLKAIINEDSILYNEYVIEGSIYDNVGHFVLCIMVILSENTGFSNFFIKAEMELFRRRLNTLSAYDMRRFSKRLHNSVKYSENTPFCNQLQVLCQHLMVKQLCQHICSQSHNVNCSTHCIRIPFKHCLSFVAKRQVELKDGIAELPCGRWIQHLKSLFCNNLKYKISKTDLTTLRRDPRIMELLQKISLEIETFNNINNNDILMSKNVDNASKFFPPCMLNLHQNLRSKHRLSHNQRFFYGLFLKDIGMPVEEAIEFWRIEYSQNPNGPHSCCHNWEKDVKKYLYGIRHMYGLEGARKNYTSVNCQRIQSIDNACSEGGCPFKSFDYPKMHQLLNDKCNDNILSQINELRYRKQYTSACKLYLKCSSNNSACDKTSFNFTPVQYFAIASKNV